MCVCVQRVYGSRKETVFESVCFEISCICSASLRAAAHTGGVLGVSCPLRCFSPCLGHKRCTFLSGRGEGRIFHLEPVTILRVTVVYLPVDLTAE